MQLLFPFKMLSKSKLDLGRVMGSAIDLGVYDKVILEIRFVLFIIGYYVSTKASK